MTVLITNGHHYSIAKYLNNPKIIYTKLDQELPKVLPLFSQNIEFTQDLEKVLTEKHHKDLILFDYSDENASKYFNLGFNVWSGNNYTPFEENRLQFIRKLEKNRIDFPNTDVAFSPEELISIIKKQKGKFVVKGWEPGTRIFTYPEQALYFIEYFQRKNPDKALVQKPVLIQQYVEGYEISVEGYFDKGNFFYANYTIEEKFSQENETGKIVGCANNVVLPLLDRPKLRKILDIMFRFVDEGYHGFFDLNFIYSSDKIYALEITPRIGYLGTITFADMLYAEHILYDDFLDKQNIPSGKYYGYGMVIELAENIECDIQPHLFEYFIPESVAWENGRYIAIDYELGCIQASATSIKEAIEIAHKKFEILHDSIPYLQTKFPDKHLFDRINFFLS